MSLDSLVGGPARIQRPLTARGRVSSVNNGTLRVLLANYSGTRDFEVPPAQWNGDLAAGQECLVVFDDQGDVWVVSGGGWPLLDLKDAGAVGDFVADDTAAIQAAVNDGRPLWVSEGTYRVSQRITLRPGLTMLGPGAGAVIKLAPNTPTNVDMLAYTPPSPLVPGTAITLSGFKIDGNQANQDTSSHDYTCLQLWYIDHLRLTDLDVTGGSIEGVYAYVCPNARLVNVNSSGNGIKQTDASGIHFDSCDRPLASGCITDDNGFHGILLTTTTDGEVTDHRSRNNGYDGARVQYSSVRNKFDHFISDGNFRGIYFTTSSADNSVDESTLRNNLTNGFVTNVASNNHVRNSLIVGNTGYGSYLNDASDVNYEFANTYRANGSGPRFVAAGARLLTEPQPGVILDTQKIVGANSAYKTITTGQRLTINAAGTTDLALTLTPTVNVWWEVDLLLGLLQKLDAAYHYCQCTLNISPVDADGLSIFTSYIMQHSTVQTFEAHTITGLFKLTAGTTYQAFATLTFSGGTWQYNQGSAQLAMMGRAWAR